MKMLQKPQLKIKSNSDYIAQWVKKLLFLA